jgi:hypothetical protein
LIPGRSLAGGDPFLKKKTTILIIIIVIIIIAGLLDLKYEGLFFQLLPEPVQSYIADIL